MGKILFICLAASLLLAPISPSRAASEDAMKLRSQNGLSAFAPPDAFLNGNYVADEIDPQHVFGKISDFAKSRSCPTAWLIDEGERQRIEKQDKSAPLEYSLFLEEDCPDKVVYYVFVDRSQAQSEKWLEWRKQFHKNKAEPQYAAVVSSLEAAAQKGFPVVGELRFIEIGGDLILKKTEEYLTSDLKVRPVFDLKQGKPVQ